MRFLILKRKLLLFVTAFLVVHPFYTAADEAPDPCPDEDDYACSVRVVRGKIESGDAEGAKELAKMYVSRFPDSRVLHLYLAVSYLRQENNVWAVRTLYRYLEKQPEDCEVRSWISWIQLNQGMLEEAAHVLEHEQCPRSPRQQSRYALIMGLIERAEKDEPELKPYIEEVRQAGELYPEDEAVYALMMSQGDPGYIPPFRGRIELSGGWTSNGFFGSPTDRTTTGDTSSGVIKGDVWTAFVWPLSQSFRPSLEAEARGLKFTAGDESIQGLSYLDMSVRPGFIFGDSYVRALVAYRAEGLLIEGGDKYEEGPMWFYEAHRGELEIEFTPELTLFGGSGRRMFREQGRSRTEFDLGLGLGTPVYFMNVLQALSGRYYYAQNDVYSLGGVSYLASVNIPLGAGFRTRIGALLTADIYPESYGYFDDSVPVYRRDLGVKGIAVFWSPAWYGLRAGVSYEYSYRNSTIDAYSFQDHRILGKVLYTFNADPWAPSAPGDDRHVPLEYGIESESSPMDEERIQDLLRQDEAARRGSSCVE